MKTAVENLKNSLDLPVPRFQTRRSWYGPVIQGNLSVNPSFTIAALAEFAMSKIPGAGDS